MDIFSILVGSKECPIKDVISVLMDDPTLIKDWSTLAFFLNLKELKIDKLRNDFFLNKITHFDLMLEILTEWTSSEGQNARLTTLLSVLQNNCSAKKACELLRQKFKENIQIFPCPTSGYEESMNSAPNKRRKLSHPVLTLKPSYMTLAEFMRGSESQPYRQTIPQRLEYYFEMKIKTRRIISDEIFQAKSLSVFLFLGFEENEISNLTTEFTTKSFEVLYNDSPIVQFTILDKPDHFDRICCITDKPVHLIQRNDFGQLVYIKSKGKIADLQRLIRTDIQHVFEEDDFINLITSLESRNTPIILAGGPGSGKSVLLAEIGRKVLQKNANQPVLFVHMTEFMKQIEINEFDDNSALIQLAINRLLCAEDKFAAIDLRTSDKCFLILLIDGFDEIRTSQIDQGLIILKEIATRFHSVRICITTRLQYLTILEQSFGVLGHTIAPFNETEQINFLKNYWSLTEGIDSENLSAFASYCLESLESHASNEEEGIADIPLHCFLIADSFKQDAKDFNKNIPNNNQSYSKSTLYKKVLEEKLSIQLQRDLTLTAIQISNKHAHLSFQQLFPQTLKYMKPLFISIKERELRNVGIINTSDDGAITTFTHVNFAEYYIAWFVVEGLKLKSESNIKLIIRFLFEEILKTEALNNDKEVFHTFENKGICYFFNSLLQSCFQDKDKTTHSQKSSSLRCGIFWERDETNQISQIVFPQVPCKYKSAVNQITIACVNSDFVHIFVLLQKLKLFNDIHESKLIFNVELIKSAVKNSKCRLISLIFAHFNERNRLEYAHKGLLLDSAISRGKFSVVELLLKEQKMRDIISDCQLVVHDGESMKCFENDNCGRASNEEECWCTRSTKRFIWWAVHNCVRSTEDLNDTQVQERRQILQTLVKLNRQYLEKTDTEKCTPLISDGVHVDLLITLIELGANVCAQNKKGCTVLHTYNPKQFSSKDFQRLVASISPENLIRLAHLKDSGKYNILHNAVETGEVELETLQRFKTSGMDFNSENDVGDTVLSTAISRGRSFATIQALIRFGADVRRNIARRGQRVQTLLHLAAKNGSPKILQNLVIEHNMDINATDKFGLTPLDYNMTIGGSFETCLALCQLGGGCKSSSSSIIQPLFSQSVKGRVEHSTFFKSNAEAKDDNGNTALHRLFASPHISCDNSNKLIMLLLDNGAKIHLGKGKSLLEVALANKRLDMRTFEGLKKKVTWIWTPSIATHYLQFLINTIGKNGLWKYEENLNLLRKMKDCVANKANINIGNICGGNLLHLAATKPTKEIKNNFTLEVIKWLIESGVDPYEKNYEDDTFLHVLLATNVLYFYNKNQASAFFHSIVEVLIKTNCFDLLTQCGSKRWDHATPLKLAVQNFPLNENTKTLLRILKISLPSENL